MQHSQWRQQLQEEQHQQPLRRFSTGPATAGIASLDDDDPKPPTSTSAAPPSGGAPTSPAEKAEKTTVGDQVKPRPSTFAHLAAGVWAGSVTTTLLHPLDLIKVRMQVYEGRLGRRGQDPVYRNSATLARGIVQERGLRGLYAGLEPALIAGSMSWGFYFFLYERAKHRHLGGAGPTAGSDARGRTGRTLLSSLEASAVTVLLTNPLWLVKTRLQLGTPYRNTLHALGRIAAEEGLLALYKGLVPALMLTSHGAIQFVVYEELKYVLGQRAQDRELGTLEFLAMGATSKIAASVVTYPTQVLKARLQQFQGGDPKYTRTWETARSVLQHEGVRGLYKGLAANMARVAPSSAIMFASYEQMMGLLVFWGVAPSL